MRKLILALLILTTILSGCKKSTSVTQWTAISSGLNTTKGLLSPKSVVVAGNNLFAITVNGVYMSINNGTNWTAVNNGLGSDSTFISSIAVTGSNLYVGTNNGNNVVYVSSNNGTSWTAIDNGLLPYYDDVTSIVSQGNNIIVAIFNGGVFETSNNGTSWTDLNQGLGADSTQVYKLVVSGNNLFAGTQTGTFGVAKTVIGKGILYLSTNNGSTWNTVNSGLPALGEVSDIALQGTNNIFVSISGTSKYGTGTVGVYLSTNNGTSWTAVNSGLTNSVTNVIPPVNTFAVSGNNIYAGTEYGGVYVSTNSGTSWSSVGTFPVNNTIVYTLAVQNNNIIAGTDDGAFLFQQPQ